MALGYRCAIAVGGVALVAPMGQAATFTWDSDGATTPAIVDGPGNWNTSPANTVWHNGTTNVVWADGNDVVFGGTTGAPGTVTINSAAVTTGDMTFNVGGYTIVDTSSSIRLIIGGDVIANESATVRSNRAALMQAATAEWTVAAGKTFTMDALAQQFIVGGNAVGRSLTINGQGTVAFEAVPSQFGLSVARGTTLNMNSGTMTVDARTDSDNLSIVIRGGSGGDPGGVFNQNGGTTDLGSVGVLNIQFANGFDGIANLNGGTLAVAKVLGATGGIGSGGKLYFNGGTLRANASDAAFIPSNTTGGLTSTFVSTGGGTIDTQGFNIGIDQVLAHDPAGAATDGGITKTGAGTLTLTQVNTYTGNTVVSNGTLALADNAGLKFVFAASGVNNSMSGTGIALLDGDFTFDLSGAATAIGSSWLVVNTATLNETFGSSFSVAGFTDAGNDLWKLTISPAAEYVFDEATGTLSVVAVPEPASLALLALAAPALLRRRRK